MVVVEAAYETPSHGVGSHLSGRLGGLKAEERSWEGSEGGLVFLHRSVVARRPYGDQTILYRIQADYGPDERVEALRVFQAVVRSFRTTRVDQ